MKYLRSQLEFESSALFETSTHEARAFMLKLCTDVSDKLLYIFTIYKRNTFLNLTTQTKVSSCV